MGLKRIAQAVADRLVPDSLKHPSAIAYDPRVQFLTVTETSEPRATPAAPTRAAETTKTSEAARDTSARAAEAATAGRQARAAADADESADDATADKSADEDVLS